MTDEQRAVLEAWAEERTREESFNESCRFAAGRGACGCRKCDRRRARTEALRAALAEVERLTRERDEAMAKEASAEAAWAESEGRVKAIQLLCTEMVEGVKRAIAHHKMHEGPGMRVGVPKSPRQVLEEIEWLMHEALAPIGLDRFAKVFERINSMPQVEAERDAALAEVKRLKARLAQHDRVMESLLAYVTDDSATFEPVEEALASLEVKP